MIGSWIQIIKNQSLYIMNNINIILVADKNVEVGVHVTLFSLLNKSSYESHTIYVITTKENGISENRLKKSLIKFDNKCNYHVIQFDDSIFSTFKGLHGNTFIYSKLALAELIKVSYALYLDVDVILNIDIREMNQYFELLPQYLIMANVETSKHNSIEKELFKNILKQNDESYYNTGVMLVNLDLWRKKNVFSSFLSFTKEFHLFCSTADQTVFNAVIENNLIYNLPKEFNFRVEYNTVREKLKNKAIFHFYGRPKHWDLLAEFVHPQFYIFKEHIKETDFKSYKSYKNISIKSIRKLIKTYKSYLKVIFYGAKS